jgi:hypothetical protein
MSLVKHKSLALVVASMGLAAVLGGSLGLAAAGVKQPLSAGFNLVGGPLGSGASDPGVAPDQFVACLPAGSWNAVYIWDGSGQQWLHFFNTSGTGIPAYVNGVNSGGINLIPRFAGVVMIMNQAVSNPRLKDTNNESCG